MTWNYRIARRRRERIFKDKVEVYYEYFLVEAYYDSKGKVGMITIEPTSLYGENLRELASGFLMMKKAFYLPVLDYDNIPEPGYAPDEDTLHLAMSAEELFRELNEGDESTDETPSMSDEEYYKGIENERVQSETLYRHLIQEFVYEADPHNFKLEDFYKKS